jgi:ankyrin repeat protein
MALHFAAPLGHESTVRLLVSTLHVNKEAKNYEGKTALDIARRM